MDKTDTIIRQRHEASMRIKRDYPDLCQSYQQRCYGCMFWHWTTDMLSGNCIHYLAPITSALLPCPYYNAL